MRDMRRTWSPLLPSEPIRFGPEFAWGVASSAFQAEGGEVPNDWVEAARSGRVPPNPGNGFWTRAEEDFRLVRSLGFGHYRLSIEWSRVEPARGRIDESALDRYRKICDAANEAGLTPWVNLFHFTHPSWFAERGGFLKAENHDDFRRHVERVGRALAGRARHFHIQNESMIYVVISYLNGENPPFLRDREAAFDMTSHVLRLHADGYQILKSIDPELTIATIEVYLDLHPTDPADAELRSASDRFDAWYNEVPLRALATGVVALPGREPEEIPHLKRALDCYGLNYYCATSLARDGVGFYSDLDDPPTDGMGRAVHPRGLEEGLVRVAHALPGVPLLVTENGCPTLDEEFRIRYIAAHLCALDRARQRGVDVRGYFHWTAVDNYEWHHGFSDARFGLIGFDPPRGDRQVKASGEWLRGVIGRGGLDPSTIP
jgi:beta-glucosidase